MAETKKSMPVPGGRLNRMARLGGLAGSVMGGMVTEGLNHARQGKMPGVSDLMLTPRNIRKVSKQLSELRGAAMKVGQLLSMDSGDLLPEELSEILSLLRADANPIPMSQVVAILNREWGEQWQEHFSRFSFQPMAAASIGQVHHAETKDNVRVAVKLQYPGVSDSIDSDIDNVAMLLRLSRLLPDGIEIRDLLNEAKIQLKLETDYLQEADNIQHFKALLDKDERFRVPDVVNHLTTGHILSMTFEDAAPLDHARTSSQETRDYIVDSIIDLVLKEVFEFQFVQTDPNIANYLYSSDHRQVTLLDFGACRRYSDEIVMGYRKLLSSALHNDRDGMISAASTIGYFGEEISDEQIDIVISLFSLVVEPARTDEAYDFSQSDLASRISELGMELSFRKNYWHTPPADAIFFHRKLIGIYLLATRFGARVNVHQYLHKYTESI